MPESSATAGNPQRARTRKIESNAYNTRHDDRAAQEKPMQTYEDDIVAWVNAQAHLLRSGRFALSDINHIAEVLETAGNGNR